MPEGWLRDLCLSLAPCPEIAEKITHTIIDNPPAAATKGNFIREGVNPELDRLRKISSGGKEYVAALQQKEAARSGISSLKIGFNNVFGYYLEVTNVHKNKVPGDWTRKQTLAGAERYITPELKEYEEQITGADEKIMALEAEVYEKLLLSLQHTLSPPPGEWTEISHPGLPALLCS